MPILLPSSLSPSRRVVAVVVVSGTRWLHFFFYFDRMRIAYIHCRLLFVLLLLLLLLRLLYGAAQLFCRRRSDSDSNNGKE